MAGKAQKIYIPLLHINRHRPHRLHSIRMEQNACFTGNPADFSNRLQGTDFIIGSHNAHQHRIRPDSVFHIFNAHKSVFVHRQICYLIAQLLHVFTGMKHGMMLNRAGDDMLALLFQSLGSAADGPVIAFASAGCKINLTGFTVERSSHLLAGIFHCAAGVSSNAVYRAGIPEMFCKIRKHRIQHLRTGRRGCRIIHIDHSISQWLFSSLSQGC